MWSHVVQCIIVLATKCATVPLITYTYHLILSKMRSNLQKMTSLLKCGYLLRKLIDNSAAQCNNACSISVRNASKMQCLLQTVYVIVRSKRCNRRQCMLTQFIFSNCFRLYLTPNAPWEWNHKNLLRPNLHQKSSSKKPANKLVHHMMQSNWFHTSRFQGRKVIPHIKMLPECRNVTKQNCVTLWETDPNGKQVWAGNEACEPVTWQECKLVPKNVKFIVPEINCTDGNEVWYHEPEVSTEVRMTNTFTCEVRY